MDRALAVFVLVTSAVAGTSGCKVLELEDATCPPGGTKLTYENFGQVFFGSYCNECHSAPDGQRQGAPDSYVFGTLAEIQANKARIYADSAGTNNSMPPGPDDPPLAKRDQLGEWLSCGAP